jgi:hypothetical protein
MDVCIAKAQWVQLHSLAQMVLLQHPLVACSNTVQAITQPNTEFEGTLQAVMPYKAVDPLKHTDHTVQILKLRSLVVKLCDLRSITIQTMTIKNQRRVHGQYIATLIQFHMKMHFRSQMTGHKRFPRHTDQPRIYRRTSGASYEPR